MSQNILQQQIAADPHSPDPRAQQQNIGEIKYGIDLNAFLVKNREASFLLRVNSNIMSGAAIHEGDVVVVDRSVEAKDENIVIASMDGALLIRKLECAQGKQRLLTPGSKLAPLEIAYGRCRIIGVVTYVIHRV